MKSCLKCGINKKVSEYYRLHSTCIKCIKDKRYKLRDAGYDCWRAMQSRCTNSNNPSWGYYGAKGRFVCPRLSNTFEDFVEVIGKRPSLKYSIDRINNSGNYTCGDCFWCLKNNWQMNIKWSDPIEQASNRSKSKKRRTGLNRSIVDIDSARGITITRYGKYRVRISFDGVMTNIGNFPTLQEAIEAKNKAIV